MRLGDATRAAEFIDPLAAEQRLLLFYHRDGLELATLRPGEQLVVGRGELANLRIEESSLSRQHACFRLAAGELWVEDLGSTNGTRVGGAPVARSVLPLGAEVQIGTVTVEVQAPATFEPRRYGLLGHEAFLAFLEDEVLRARTFGEPFALLQLAGPLDGASRLPRWAPLLREALRPVDRLGRYGPETVEVLLPHTDTEGARVVAERLLAPRAGLPPLRCGLASWPEHGTDLEALLAASRAALLATSEAETLHVAPAHWPGTLSLEVRPPAESVTEAAARKLARIAAAEISVLIVGETGVGKERAAAAIHAQSARVGRPLVAVNCGALPAALLESTLFGHERGAFTGAERTRPGVFESAEGGTVFLDEVGELSPAAQAALLRVLETKRVTRVGSSAELAVDVRVVAATHRDLEAMVRRGEFREDLLYRLNAVTLELPPLRARRAEIEALVQAFLAAANQANGRTLEGLDPAALALLQSYAWPGNLRELRNVIERAVVLAEGPLITVEDLPERLRKAPPASAPPDGSAPDSGSTLSLAPFNEQVERFESALIVDALRQSGGNQSEAARLLHMPRRTLINKLKAYGIRGAQEES
ncbi:MAG: sigma 54-interacting transcriptional regulator [Deltaproteobacteria bacterium]|nr:sigma 54-interacting transcriptional regulator [Deltaproteobacteria bacterium]